MPLFGPPNIEKLKEKRDVEGLIKAFRHKDEDVRRKATKALGDLKHPLAVESLIVALADEDWRVRVAVAKALGEIGEPRAVEPLIAALEENAVQVSAAQALGKMGTAAVEPLVAILHHADSEKRVLIIRALYELRDVRAVEPIARTLDDRDSEVRRAAGTALGEMNDPRGVEPLIAAMTDHDEGVRLAAALSLGQIGDPRAVRALTLALNDNHRRFFGDLHEFPVRDAARKALVRLGEEAVEFLIRALNDPNGPVRAGAALILGELRDERAVEPLITALRDHALVNSEEYLLYYGGREPIGGHLYHPVRDAAETALRNFGGTAVEKTVALLHSTDSGTRVRAAEVLSWLGDPQVLEALATALADPHEMVRRESKRSLERIGGPEAERLLHEYRREKRVKSRFADKDSAMVGLDEESLKRAADGQSDSFGGWLSADVAASTDLSANAKRRQVQEDGVYFCQNCGQRKAELTPVGSGSYALCSETCRRLFGEKMRSRVRHLVFQCKWCASLLKVERQGTFMLLPVEERCPECRGGPPPLGFQLPASQ